MNIIEVLTKYGLDLQSVTSEDGLLKLAQAYNEQCDSLVADTDTAAARAKAVRDDLAKSAKVGEAEFDLRETVADLIDREGCEILVDLVETVQKIKSDLLTMRDQYIAQVVKDSKPVQVRDSAEIEERKTEASTLREAIESVHTLMGRPEMRIVSDTPEDAPEDFEPVVLFATKKNAKNETVPNLRKTPGGNASGNVGRGAKARRMLFAVDGENIAEGTFLSDVVRFHLNNFRTGVVWETTDVKSLVDASGQTFLAEGFENRWTINMASKMVSGWLPVSESAEDSDEDSEED